MIHFNYTSEELLTIRVIDNFNKSDIKRIALFLEASYGDNFSKEICFEIISDLPTKQMVLLGEFCQKLPYDFRIDSKNFLPAW
jgi:hypothetical protein